MLRLVFLLCTVLFVTVNAAVVKIAEDGPLKKLNNEFNEFKDLWELLNKTKTDIPKDQNPFYDIIRSYNESLNRDFEVINASLKNAYKEPKSIKCTYHIDELVDMFEHLKSKISNCAELRMMDVETHFNQTIINATKAEDIMKQHVRKSKACLGERCASRLQDYLTYSHSAIQELKDNYAKFNELLQDTETVRGCMQLEVDYAMYYTDSTDYVDYFKQCLSLETNKIF